MRQLSQSPDPTGANTAVDQIRLFRNRPEVRWEYRIHEQILLSIRRTHAAVRSTGVVIDHNGYEDPDLRQRKLERNTRLLEIAYAEKPEDPIIAFNLAWVYQKSTHLEQALSLLELCKRRLSPQVSIVPKVYRLLAQVLERLDRMPEAFKTFAAARELWPRDIDLLLYYGLLLRKVKDYAAAEECFRTILTVPPGNYPVGLDLGLLGYKTHNALAELYFEQRRLDEAETEWKAAVDEQPGFGPGWVGLAEVEAFRGRKTEAATILDRIQAVDPQTKSRIKRLRQILHDISPGSARNGAAAERPPAKRPEPNGRPKLNDQQYLVASASRPKVSLCMIVKNEERNLPACLGPLRSVVDEMIVLDTGSTDNTRTAARSLGAQLFEMPWSDSFAIARNASIEHVRGDWIFWMDADDRIDPANIGKLKSLFASLEDYNRAYVMKCKCVSAAPGGTVTSVDHVRLFRNNHAHRFTYRVHEQILPAIRKTKGDVHWSDVVIFHTGYVDPTIRRAKLDRDLRLLRLDEKEFPDDPYILFNLGSVLQELKQPRDALRALNRSLQRSHEKDSIIRKLYALIARCYLEIREPTDALQACAAGRSVYPDDAELLFLESGILRQLGEVRGAEERLHRLIDGQEENHFCSIDVDLRGYKARHSLALICMEQKRFAEAETHWTASVREQPDFFPSHVGLGELYAKAKKWQKLETHAASLARFGPLGEEAHQFLLALGKMHKGELSDARSRLLRAAEQFPDSLRVKRLLAEVTLKEGVDMAAAEKILREILELDPSDRNAEKAIRSLQLKREREKSC